MCQYDSVTTVSQCHYCITLLCDGMLNTVSVACLLKVMWHRSRVDQALDDIRGALQEHQGRPRGAVGALNHGPRPQGLRLKAEQSQDGELEVSWS